MTYQKFKTQRDEILDGDMNCDTEHLRNLVDEMLNYIQEKEEEDEYTFSEKSTKEIELNWYNKVEDGYFQDLLGAETLPKYITEKKLKEIGLIFSEDGAEITTKEQVEYLSQFLETKIDLDEYDYALNIFYVYRGGTNETN